MKRILLFLALGALVVLLYPAALAQTAGCDLLKTASGASVDITGIGTVNLQGVPITGSLGSTDTIVQRTQNGPGQVNIQVYALFMKSTSPVTFSGQSADVYVTLNNSGGTFSTIVLPQPDALSASTGTDTIRTDGTFDSSFTVNADLIFVKAGTSVTNSANYLGHQAAPSKKLTLTNASWSSSAPAGYPSFSACPAGGFYPDPKHIGGPHPVVPAGCGSGIVSPSAQKKPSGEAAIAICKAVAQ